MQVSYVAENSPAERAGFAEGDYITAIDGREVWRAGEINDYNRQHAGEEVVYTLNDNEETTVILNTSDAEYLLGITMTSTQTLTYATWSAPIVGVGLTTQLTGETFKGVGTMLWDLVSGVARQFSGDASVRESGQEAISAVGDSVSGPVGIVGQLFPAFTAAGPRSLAFLAALISVSLACMNVLPIPALDGGRWLLIAIYRLRKKKLTKEVEEKIVARAMMALLALIFLVTILDIIKITNGG